MLGEEGNTADYLNEYCIYTAKLHDPAIVTDAWKENVIHNRTIILEEMNLSFDIEPDFFMKNPPTAEWNPKKHYFNLTSGKHRTSFLAARHCKFIPLKISKADYLQFLHMETWKTLEDALNRHQGELKAPIYHPYAYRYPCCNRESFFHILEQASLWLGETAYRQKGRCDFRGYRVLDASGFYSMLALHFTKMGCEADLLEDGDREVSAAFQQLFYVTRISRQSVDTICQKEYDLVFWNDNLGEIPENILKRNGKCYLISI